MNLPRARVGAELSDELHFLEEEPGRVRESYNARLESMAGVYAGIVEAESRSKTEFVYDGSWWDNWEGWKLNPWYLGKHSLPNLADNLYRNCNDLSPHPFCLSTADDRWTKNFRNMPLQMQVGFELT
jgi:hypothetical protein